MKKILLPVLILATVGVVFVGYELVLARPFVAPKLRGMSPHCPWWATLRGVRRMVRFDQLINTMGPLVTIKSADAELDAVLVESPARDFWVRREGLEYDGRELVAYLLAERRWLSEMDPDKQVKPNEVVLDCEAHVGVFTDSALRRGATRVIAVEPDPLNLECLRRNFRQEIASGQVVLVEKAVWDREGTIKFRESNQNSGGNSAVMGGQGRLLQLPATTIDRISEEFGRIDYIKMDIEGAERKALAGANDTLREWKPRLAIEAYHLEDDGSVLPALIRRENPEYSIACGACGLMSDGVVPYIFYAE